MDWGKKSNRKTGTSKSLSYLKVWTRITRTRIVLPIHKLSYWEIFLKKRYLRVLNVFVTDVIDTRLSYNVSIMQKATFWLFLKEFMWRSRYDCMSFITKENIILDYYWCQFPIGTVSWLVYLTVDWLLTLIDIPRHFHPRKSQQITREMERVNDRAVIPPQNVITTWEITYQSISKNLVLPRLSGMCTVVDRALNITCSRGE